MENNINFNDNIDNLNWGGEVINSFIEMFKNAGKNNISIKGRGIAIGADKEFYQNAFF